MQKEVAPASLRLLTKSANKAPNLSAVVVGLTRPSTTAQVLG